MDRQLRRWVLVGVATWVFAVGSAAADPVRLLAYLDVSGRRTTAPFVTIASQQYPPDGARLWLTLQGLGNDEMDPSWSSWRTPMPCMRQIECVPGQRVNFSNELLLRVPVVAGSIIDGVARPWWESQIALEGSLRFLMNDLTLPLTTPVVDDYNGPVFTRSQSYRFTGELRLVGSDIGARSYQVFGSGTAYPTGLINAIRVPNNGNPPWAPYPGVANVDEVRFVALATPEPATLFLFGTGLAGLALPARRRRTPSKAITKEVPQP